MIPHCIEPKIRESKKGKEVVEYVFRECLWNKNRKSQEGNALKCRNVTTRTAAYDFLKEMTRSQKRNIRRLIEYS